ncbi:hypothetical protein VB715_11855 [Crocosphaera sp. UHCC 0190]|uniref:tetratricopeptide repeat protein n=1 Tax=Crocosphaera sp. UHCC 0190 TaxID=3110246 RepID=UPI002B1F7364|nr:hypothetical protein [Crocosphaera sp. UHCC 0190]MEA5510460.1 hypothetical protein [Crocosphaera sp. UHCC 0190]
MLNVLRINQRTYFLLILTIILGSTSCLVNNKTWAAPIPAPELNPLEIPLVDPLIPPIPRPLTPLEQKKLRKELDNLNNQAQEQLDGGNIDVAFQIWYRELRLRRVLGRIEELAALGRVGEIAWNRTRKEDVQIIGKRIFTLQQLSEQEDPLSPELLMALADAYAKLHSLDNSIIIYKKVLANARNSQTPLTEKQSLQGLGKLYLAKFDYPNSALVYEELLDQAQAQRNVYEEGLYLQVLAEIYTASLQPENAANIKQRLVDNYLRTKKIEFIPPLKIDMGQDYQSMDKPELASQSYQEAYSLAWSLQLLGAASDALTRLGDLYETYEQKDYALQIYQRLIQVEQLSYNYYGLMKTYDKIGEIYLGKQQYQKALQAFQQGLILARSINYKQEHFLAQLQKVDEGMQGKLVRDQNETPVENPLTPPTNTKIPDIINNNNIEEQFNRDNILPADDWNNIEEQFNRDNRLLDNNLNNIPNELNQNKETN